MFARDVGRTVEASAPVQQSVEMLRSVKSTEKELEEMEETLLLQIQTHMGDASTLLTPDGQIAATWKRSKDSQRVDLDKLRSEYADVYQRCLKVQEGFRRFLLK
jgi:predicted phage-related endonuclease